MKTHLPTVTIGIPAHNEERNIGRLLKQISNQKGNFNVKEVIVVCDGCTDQTATVALSYQKSCPQLRVWNDGLRQGQAERLNQLYRHSKSDFFVTFDADISLSNTKVIENLLVQFKDAKVGLVGGNDLPAKPQNLLQLALASYETIWKNITSSINQGNNVHHMPGRISAVRKEIIQDCVLPLDIVANDHFLYFYAIKHGWQFRYAPQAQIFFQLPSTVSEFFLQSARFMNSQQNIVRHFGDQVEAEYAVPRNLKLKTYGRFLVHQPATTLLALTFQAAQQLTLPFLSQHGKKQLWHHISSSKSFGTS